MIIKRVFIGILLILAGCERKDIIETYVFSDMTKTQYFFYKIKREDSIVDINVKGYMDGSLGFGKTICGDTTEFKASQLPISVAPPFDSLYKNTLSIPQIQSYEIDDDGTTQEFTVGVTQGTKASGAGIEGSSSQTASFKLTYKAQDKKLAGELIHYTKSSPSSIGDGSIQFTLEN
ncbi:hypothetical protein [Runella salmonicolor]|uniref:Lipoprotein n=1 Tax=Runella salmonicolor TaxID=2950278 RepID=A0ABT1FWI6_9BACT|nr:hypothetical protein [Runella salmonicolor]MCP1386017.1 hypothetical protein [Runella salmonicolor]